MKNVKLEYFTTSTCKMTTNEVPPFGKECPGGNKWEASHIANLFICVGSQEKDTVQDNSQGADNDGGG